MYALARRVTLLAAGIAVCTMMLAGCGSSSTAGPTGTVSVALTDAPGLEYSHVWITVKEVWFHTSDSAGSGDTGWLKYPLTAPVTLDLAQLTNGALNTVWNNLELPVGSYQQIRIFLASTEEALTASAAAQGLSYNNQINLLGDANAYALRVPTPDDGIRLAGTFQVTGISPLRLVVDFDADDVVRTQRSGSVEFILKPRLKYFDLDRAAAISGALARPDGSAFTNYTGAYNFVIKAEQSLSGTDYRVVRRATTVRSDGTFTLYPLPVFGNASTATYDVLIRGRRAETTIVQQVRAHRGTTPATAVSLGPAIPVIPGTEYPMNVTVKPSGAWVNFYQSLPSDPVKYEVRFRHTNPFSGSFLVPINLSRGALHVGSWNSGGPVSFATVAPLEGQGGFSAAAEAFFFDRSPYQTITPATSSPVDFGTLTVSAPYAKDSISGNLLLPMLLKNKMNQGVMLVTRGGMIIDKVDISSFLGMGGSYSIANLPGGTLAAPAAGAFYGLYALGWDSAHPLLTKAFGRNRMIDLRTGNAAIDLQMISF